MIIKRLLMGLLRRFAPRNDRKLLKLGVFVQTLDKLIDTNILVMVTILLRKSKTIVEDFLNSDNWKIIDRDIDTFVNAIDLVSEYGIHLWGTLIAACMKENDIADIVTENKNDFKKIKDIEVTVPF